MAASDKRELILDLLARDKTGDGTRSASKNIKDVGDSADKSSKKLGLFGKSAKEADDKAEGLSREADQTGRALEKLDGQIKLAEHELKGLARAFAETDDAAERLDIGKVQRKLQSDIRNLSKNKSLLTPILLAPPSEEDTRHFGEGLSNSLKKGFSFAKDHMKGIGIGLVGTALAPEVAGLLAAAVVGGVGLGGIVGGVALAAKNPAISGWAGRIGKTFMAGITKEAQGSFTKPLEGSLGQLEAAAADAVPKIGQIFQNLAPALEPLTKSIITAGNSLLDSFVYGSSKAKPVLDALGRLIVGVGDDFASLTKQFADHSDVAADAVDHLTSSVHLMTEGLGPLITVLAETYSWLDKVKGGADGIPLLGEALKGFTTFLGGPLTIVGGFVEMLDKMKGKTKEATWVTPQLTEEQQKLKTAMDDATKAARGEQDALDELAKQMKAQSDPVFAVLDGQEKLRKAQTNLNKAIHDHGRNSDEARDAERRLAESAIDLEGAVGALGGTFDGKMTPAMRATLEAAGLTKKQINNLEKQFGDAKKAGNDFARRYAADAAVNGVPGAIARIKSLKAELKSIKPNWTVTIRQNFLTFGKPYSPAGIASGNVGGLATGGSVREGTPTWVGEHGPELLMMDRPARVLSAAASRGLTQGGSQMAGAFQPQGLRIELAGQQEIVSMFRYLIRTANLIQ